VLDYANRVEAVVDIGTLKQKMGVFTDFLLTELIYMPEDIADLLWMSARDSDDPEREIRHMLSDRIEKIVKKAKEAAAKIGPPPGGVKYIMLDMEDDEKRGQE
jgi:hypothetical protein